MKPFGVREEPLTMFRETWSMDLPTTSVLTPLAKIPCHFLLAGLVAMTWLLASVMTPAWSMVRVTPSSSAPAGDW